MLEIGCPHICSIVFHLLIVAFLTVEIAFYNLTLGHKIRQLLEVQNDPSLRDRLDGILIMLLARDIVETILTIVTVLVKYAKFNFKFGMAVTNYGCVLLFRAQIINLITRYNEVAIDNKLDASEPIMIVYWIMFILTWLLRLITVTKIIYCPDKACCGGQSNRGIV